jgi:phenylacetate-coenzyme A ligase PaaK-like adenylate-forming protein
MDIDASERLRFIEARIFTNLTETEFASLALEIFRFQYENNRVYNEYVKALGIDISAVSKITEIPFLPIAFFKSHKIACGDTDKYEVVFKSSTTTGAIPSNHFVKDINLYKDSFSKGFEQFYGDVKQYCLLALLPSYLERGDSSLVYMTKNLIEETQNPDSGFYMDNYAELAQKLKANEANRQKTLLIGVTYALLKLAEEYPVLLKNTVVIETGGMKGRREELTREEVHKTLKDAFGVENIHSEYGMTELLSQAYSKGKGVFQCVPWMRVLVRDVYDPFEIVNSRQSSVVSHKGAINIIDLANINSCSFIATDDLGVLYPNGDFEVAGRLDSSDIRGCNLMASEL